MKFSNISLKKKIFILLALPVFGLLWLSISTIINNFKSTQEMATLTQLTELSVVYSELVHELQKERGMTAGYLGSKGNLFSQQLSAQRAKTDLKRVQLAESWQKKTDKNDELKQLHTLIVLDLDDIATIRAQVDRLTIKQPKAIGYYTQLNAVLLGVSQINVKISNNAEITQNVIAYYNFLQAKERAGIERAVLSSVFAKGAFKPDVKTKFIRLVTEQDTYFAYFKAFANKSSTHYFTEQLDHAAVHDAIKIRQIAMTQQSDFNIEAEHWFERATARINQLKVIEDQLAQDLLSLTQRIKDDAFYAMLTRLSVTVVLLLVMSLISYYTIKSLTFCVKDIMQVMKRVRDDNDLTAQTENHGKSELGEIASALNLTLSKFSESMKEINLSSESLAASSEQTSQTCEHNFGSLREQQDGIALIATAVEELSATVREVASNTQQTADSAKDADQKAINGLEVVKTSYQSIDELAHEINTLADKISSLHDSSKNITTVIDVIKAVAEQTNLLALNAAIEAARAGEQGRGFAVVADEVRNLAQRTQESTAEIENLISSLQSDVQGAFTVIESSQKKSSQTVEHSKNVEHVLEDITGAVSDIFAMTDQIATATEEQSVVTQDIAQNIVTIEDQSMSTTTGADQILITAKEQSQLASTLQNIASIFKV